jgi:hypothetical protein
MTNEQSDCEHDIAWAADDLDGMCCKCRLYVMRPNCVAETAQWFCDTFGVTAEEMYEMGDR